jgi:DNA-binding LytR/AlgR family response regulator
VAGIGRLKPAYAFLDIRMPGLNGLEVAATAGDTRVVFVTAYEEYAVAAFEASAVDYLLKPVADARLAQCVARLQKSAAAAPDLAALLQRLQQHRPAYLAWLHVGAGNTTRVLAVDEVLHFQAGDKYTEVVTANERHVIRMSLKELGQRLDPERFAQIHRGSIVNLKAIERIDRDMLGRTQVHLKGHDDVLTVSRAYLARFRQM